MCVYTCTACPLFAHPSTHSTHCCCTTLHTHYLLGWCFLKGQVLILTVSLYVFWQSCYLLTTLGGFILPLTAATVWAVRLFCRSQVPFKVCVSGESHSEFFRILYDRRALRSNYGTFPNVRILKSNGNTTTYVTLWWIWFRHLSLQIENAKGWPYYINYEK